MWTLSGHASGNSGSGSFESASILPSSSSTLHGIRRRRSSTHVDAAAELGVGRRLDSVQGLEHRLADGLPELVAALEAVPAGLEVAEPVVPGGDVARAALEEDALGARHAGLDRLAQRAGEVGVPEQALAADQRRVAGEARDDGDRRSVLAVDPQHRHGVVDRSLALHPVDADPRRAAGAPADARRLPASPGGVDGAGEQVGQRLHPGRERAGVGEPGDGRAARDARRAVVVRGVHEHGLGRDPGQLLHALAHGGGHVRAGEDEVGGDDRDLRAPVVEDERLPDHRLADSLGEAGAGRPAAVRQAGGRGDVDTGDAGGQIAHGRSFLHLSRATSSAYASGRRFLSANHGFSRACSSSAGSSSTAIHWSPVPGSDCASIDPSGART